MAKAAPLEKLKLVWGTEMEVCLPSFCFPIASGSTLSSERKLLISPNKTTLGRLGL
jgi:hypothetical protein